VYIRQGSPDGISRKSITRPHEQTARSVGVMLSICPFMCVASASYQHNEASRRLTHLSVHVHLSSGVNRERRPFLQELSGRFLGFAPNGNLTEGVTVFALKDGILI
jgi:hypothetical protein